MFASDGFVRPSSGGIYTLLVTDAGSVAQLRTHARRCVLSVGEQVACMSGTHGFALEQVARRPGLHAAFKCRFASVSTFTTHNKPETPDADIESQTYISLPFLLILCADSCDVGFSVNFGRRGH